MAARKRETPATLFALCLFALSAWQANRQVCPGCTSSDITLALSDGTPIHARLYLPPVSGNPQFAIRNPQSGRLPAVIVCHGYLGNLAFMEIPWAADLTQLGMAAVFLDRRGHGRSGGTLWRRRSASQRLDDLEPDITAGIAYLRGRQPLIDPERIALLGHSDGATAAITAASADWDVRATVAVSASVAPWQFVNHVAPQNLLLVYGAEDHFVLNETDGALIARGTRGYLAGPGQFGDVADGSARRLLRVASRGHLDVLNSKGAREQILGWLEEALEARKPPAAGVVAGAEEAVREVEVDAAGGRMPWVWTGVAALLASVALWRRPSTGSGRAEKPNGIKATTAQAEPFDVAQDRPVEAGFTSLSPVPVRVRVFANRLRFIFRAAALVIAWTAGLLLAPWLARQGQAYVPGQEGAVVVGLLLGPTAALALGSVLAALPSLRRKFPSLPRSGQGRFRYAVHGLLIAAALFVAVHLLLLHHYDIHLDLPRCVLFLVLTAFAAPTFGMLDLWLRWVGSMSHEPSAMSPHPFCLLLLAAVTAVLSAHLFERMSMLPGFLLAATLVACAAQRLGHRASAGTTSTTFGAATIGWFGAVACALY